MSQATVSFRIDRELERRVANLNAGISTLKAHELIEVD